ncbi:MAG: YlxQ-related RNA-binding protein [Lactobacillales bacterium]|jgi:ribosomal protein L7Ae-like RNA K-turn-binding protein|nr:YlxQ-related RNA-binding protein [Lactobacillales bacterium]
MNKSKILNFLGLAMRAGKIITGESLVIEAIRTRKAKLVFLASDSGVSTSKKVTDKAKFYGIEIIDLFTSDELSQAIGKARKVLAVSDKGFAKNLMKLSK